MGNLLTLGLTAAMTLSAAQLSHAEAQGTLYYGGPILTMEGDKPAYAEVVVSDGGMIAFVGKDSAARKQFPDARMIDLQGKFLMPSFRDPHGHFAFAVQMVDQVNLAIPPVGPVTSIAKVIEQLSEYKKERSIKDGEFIIGWGYDQDGLKEKRHITRLDLDKAFPDNPIILIHVSGHGGVLNSKALEWAGLTKDSETPPGGIIARLPGGSEPAGLIMETAWVPVMGRLPRPSLEHRLAIIGDAQMEYASNGYTSAVEGFALIDDVDFLQTAASEGKLFIDVAALMGFPQIEEWLDNPKYPFENEYTNNFRIAAMKITQDGSPQGKTAYMREPYLTGGPAGEKNWRGEPSSSKQAFEKLVKTAMENKLPLQVHCNGDAAIDMVIDAVRASGITARDDRRTVVVHSNLQAPGQLDAYVELGLTPSYFTNHAYFWGDVHVENFGSERAFNLSPMKTARAKGLVVANHTDFNITPLDPFFTMWTAMNRESRTGVIIGPDERVDAYTALQALTTGPAWQFFEEERVGKLKPGMEASFVILDRNPLKVAGTDEIKDIVVLETIKEGTTIYKATTAGPDTNRTIGSDRDAYGCLPAAGYSWCARIEKCVRPWQLASKEGFENTLGAFDKYCGNSGN